jgi:hypothetical protein
MRSKSWLIVIVLAFSAGVIAGIIGYRSSVSHGVPSPDRSSAPAGERRSVLFTNYQWTSAFDWGRVESADYVRYVQNLKAIGCPKETVVDIIVADVNKLYSERARGLREGTNGIPAYQYWKTHSGQLARSFRKTEVKKRLLELDKERLGLIYTLLGNDIPKEKLGWSVLVEVDQLDAHNIDFLPVEKQQALRQIDLEYAIQVRNRIKPGAQDPNGLAEIDKLRKEKESRISEILTKEEKFELEVRNSPTATRLVSDIDGFDPSEGEFRTIFAMRKDFEDRFNVSARPASPEEVQARLEAEAELKSRLRQELGEKRFSEYQQVTDPTFKFIQKSFKDIPRERQTEIYTLWTDAYERSQAVRAEQSLSVEERLARLKQIASATRNAIQPIFGDATTLQRIVERLERADYQERPGPPSTTVFFDR